MVTFTINKCHYLTEVKIEGSSLLVSHDGADRHTIFFMSLSMQNNVIRTANTDCLAIVLECQGNLDLCLKS